MIDPVQMTLKNWESYNDFCDYLSEDKPQLLYLEFPTILTEHYQVTVSKEFSFIFDDLKEYDNPINHSINLKNRKLVTVDSDELLIELIDFISKHKRMSYDMESTDLNTVTGTMIGFSVGISGTGYYLPHLTWDTISQSLVEVFTKEEVRNVLLMLVGKELVTWNGSFDTRYTRNFFDVDLVSSIYADVMLMKHTIAEEGDFSLKGNAIEFQKEIGLDMLKEANEEQLLIKENVTKNGGILTKAVYELYKADLHVMGKYAAADADLTFRLFELFSKKLEEEGLINFFYNEEVMPTYKEAVIVMENHGVKLDLDLINNTQKAIIIAIEKLEKQVIDHLFSLKEVQNWRIAKANELYKESRKGKFASYLVDKYEIPLERSKSGLYSFTVKTIEKLPDSSLKRFLMGQEELDIDTKLEVSLALFDQLEPLNISSKKQMGEIVFTYLKIKPLGLTKGGSSQFDEDLIQYLADEFKYDWATSLSDYNKLIKIKGTYIDRFLDAHINGYYYFSYKQHGTISGRLSGDAQQLPRPKEEGEVSEIVRGFINVIRAFFIAGEGRKFIDCDYESLEPHIFAHVSGDEGLRDIFRKGHDFYSTIAIATEKITDMSADKKSPIYLGKLDKPRRQKAKAYSLGVPYGMTDFALGKTLDVSTKEGKSLIDGYLNGFPELKKWMHNSERQVQQHGYIVTEAGRIRHLPRAKELHKDHGNKLLDYIYRNTIKKKYGSDEVLKMYRDYKNSVNNAKNVQIQSLGASIINKACVAISREFEKRDIDAWICAQIHDQAIFNVPDDKVEECKELIKTLMENTTKISIDLKAPPSVSLNWRDGH